MNEGHRVLPLWWQLLTHCYCVTLITVDWVFADITYCNRHYTVLVSFMSVCGSGLKPDVEAFFLYCVTMSMVSLSAVSLAFLISASVGSFAMANILIALPYVVMMVRLSERKIYGHVDSLLFSKKENKQKKKHLLHFLIGSVHFSNI